MARLTIAGTLLVLSACTDPTTITGAPDATMAPGGLSANVVSETSTDLWARIVTGETGPGALYQLYLPREWNGTTVFYAHGFRDVLLPVSLRDDQDNLAATRDQLGQRGIGVAYSSYSENGFAEKDGVQRTHQLRGLFASQFGTPRRSLIVGHSLGGLVATNLAEKFPDQYDGAAVFCGVVGGTPVEFNHMVTTRLLFDLFYPGIMPGTYDEIPPGLMVDQAKQGQIIAAVTANPIGLLAIASIKQANLQFQLGSPQMQQQMVTSLITALTFHARGGDNVLPLMNGFPFDNKDTVYTASAIPLLPPQVLSGILAMVNTTAPRRVGDPSAVNYVERYFTPSGALRIPTITLHNNADPLVPFFHEGLFAGRVNNAGASALLVQRVNSSYGHCVFPVADQVQMIADLDTWVATGIKPAN